MELFRVKFVLEDGRKVYMSKRGLVHLQDQAGVAQVLKLREPRPGQAHRAAYTADLSAYGSMSVFEPRGIPLVSIVLTVPEPADSPIDPEAFVLGGSLARDVGTTR
jgi:hypothetical protein